jgi:hypothetical protein
MSNCTLVDKVRQPKFLNMAIFDWSATLLVVFLVSLLTCTDNCGTTFLLYTLAAIVIFVSVHKATNTPTMFNYYLGLNDKESVLARRKNCPVSASLLS